MSLKRHPAKACELAKWSAPGIHHWKTYPDGHHRWTVGNGLQDTNSKVFTTYARAHRCRMAAMLAIAIRASETGLEGILTYGAEILPPAAYRMAEAMERATLKAGKPRGGWKWPDKARQAFSEKCKAAAAARPKQSRQRGYPPAGFTAAGEFHIPPEGHRFTVTRADLEHLLKLIAP